MHRVAESEATHKLTNMSFLEIDDNARVIKAKKTSFYNGLLAGWYLPST